MRLYSPRRNPLLRYRYAPALVTLVFGLLFNPAMAGSGDPPGWNPDPMVKTQYPDWFLDSFLDLEEDIANAKAEGKKGIMVVFSMPFCSFCKQFIRTTLKDEHIVSDLRANLDSVHLDLFSDAEMVSPKGETMSVKAFGKLEGGRFHPSHPLL